MKWEFTLYSNTEAGQNLINRLKENKIILNFTINSNRILNKEIALLNAIPSGMVSQSSKSIIAHKTNSENFFFIYFGQGIGSLVGAEKIGEMSNVEGMTQQNLKSLANGDSIELVLTYGDSI